MNIIDRVDDVTTVTKDRFVVKPPVPKSIKIELVGGICDHKCKYCAVAQKLRKSGFMDWDLYTRIIDEMVKLGIKESGMFFLGESFLDKRLPKAIKYAKDAGIEYVFCTTNGKAADKSIVKECMEAGLDSLKFSFNYADKEQYEEMTGVPAKYFDVLIQHIKDAHAVRKEGNYNCELSISSIKYDDEQAVSMEKAIQEIEPYIDRFYYLPLYSQAGLNMENMTKLGKKPVKGNFGRWGKKDSTISACFSLFSELRITWDGQGAMCCFDHSHQFSAGQVQDLGIMGVWHSEPYQELRKHMIEGDMTGTPCEKCWTCTFE